MYSSPCSPPRGIWDALKSVWGADSTKTFMAMNTDWCGHEASLPGRNAPVEATFILWGDKEVGNYTSGESVIGTADHF